MVSVKEARRVSNFEGSVEDYRFNGYDAYCAMATSGATSDSAHLTSTAYSAAT
jgi:hypothetical protein